VTNYVSSRDIRSLDEILKSAEVFQKQVSKLMPKYAPEYIINTDQTGCEY
jgi:hypothetical protein